MSKFALRARDMQLAIKQILLKEWDPIGVQAIPEAEDEYDAYVAAVYSMLIARKPVQELFEYLLSLETEHMGLSADQQRTRYVAEKLRELCGEYEYESPTTS